MPSYPEAQLCKQCEHVLSSHWVAKDSFQLKNAYQDEKSNLTGKENASNSDDDASSNEGFYEAPDWVTVVTADDTTPRLLRSPPHHNLADLEKSAGRGCYLCILFWDRVRDEMRNLAAEKKAVLDRLLSFVIARPSYNDSFEEEIIQLELAYFLDGLIESDAFTMTVGIILYKLLPGEAVTEETFQPPLYYEGKEDPLRRSIGCIRQWISTCDNHHLGCKRVAQSKYNMSNPYQLPTRLLQLEHKMGSSKINLFVRSTNSCSPHTKYATLSHCWGTSQPVKLLTKNYEQFSQGIDFSLLPQTFQDAATLSLALDIEYLWIDSLCIIQDSRDDWLREASLMCSVYSNSWVNFAATSSRDGTGGLFHKSALVKNCVIDATWAGLPRGMYLCGDETAWQRRVENGPLNQRGWVLQERLLSPRTVHCAYDQMWWSCQDTPNCCETFPKGHLILPLTASPSLAHMHEFDGDDFVSWNEAWLNVVRSYTKAKLTYGSDKLIAFAGIAQEAKRSRGFPDVDYLAGLWRNDLLVDLLWRMADLGARETTEYRAPSWSWASVDGEVYFHASEKRAEARENMVAKILESHISTSNGWSGPVSDGWLKISGPIFNITLNGVDTPGLDRPYLQELYLGDEKFTSDEGFAEALDDEALYNTWPETDRQLHYACLKATSQSESNDGGYESEGLILENAPEKNDGFRRIGWLRVFHETPWTIACQSHRTYILW